MRRIGLLSGLALLSAGAFVPAWAEDVKHEVTGYQVSLFRDGGSSDFQGWIRLVNGTTEVGFIYIRNGQPGRPFLGSTKYVVIDIPVDMLDVTVAMLNSGKPVFISYGDGGNPNNASAFLDIGGDAQPGDEAMQDIRSTFRIQQP